MNPAPRAVPAARPTRPAAPGTTRARRADRLFWALLGVVLAVALVNVLWHMTDQNLGDWDEGRHTVTAYEMLRRGDLLVNTWRGAADYWNLKPPLSFWPIIGSFAAFGTSTFALRLPSAIFFVATVACVAVSAARTLGRRASLVAAAALATCYPVIGSHSGRTADPDALFVLLVTVALLAVFGAPERPRLLLLWTTAFSAAFLTKSWHAGLVLVVGVLFLVLRGRASRARAGDYAVALLGFLPVAAWAIARSTVDGTRFFTAMVQYDLTSRSTGALESNAGGPLLYVERLVYLAPWVLVALPLLVPEARRALRRGAWRTAPWLGPLLAAVVVIGAFSVVKTKLPWYAYPALPQLAIGIGAAAAWASRARTRRVLALTAVGAVLAGLAGEAYVLHRIPAPTAPAQSALALLRDQRLEGTPVYLDETLQATADDENERLRAKVGDWPQSLRASALINGHLVPREGGTAAFEAASGRRLAVLRVGSAEYAALLPTGRRVAAADGVVVLEAG